MLAKICPTLARTVAQRCFLRPDRYMYKEPAVAINYQAEEDHWLRRRRYVRWLEGSAEWLDAELSLQQRFEDQAAEYNAQRA
jgi:hypothetical protein